MSDLIDRLASLSGLRLDGEERERLRASLVELQSLIDSLPPVEEGSGANTRAPEADTRAPDLTLRADDPGVGLPADVALAWTASRSGDWLDSPPVRKEPA